MSGEGPARHGDRGLGMGRRGGDASKTPSGCDSEMSWRGTDLSDGERASPRSSGALLAVPAISDALDASSQVPRDGDLWVSKLRANGGDHRRIRTVESTDGLG
jgi:hypothetical protein